LYTAINVVAVRCSLAMSINCIHCHISLGVLAVNPASSRPASARPDHLDHTTVTREVAAAAHHLVYHVRRHLGRLVLCAVLDSDYGRQQHVLVTTI